MSKEEKGKPYKRRYTVSHKGKKVSEGEYTFIGGHFDYTPTILRKMFSGKGFTFKIFK